MPLFSFVCVFFKSGSHKEPEFTGHLGLGFALMGIENVHLSEIVSYSSAKS